MPNIDQTGLSAYLLFGIAFFLSLIMLGVMGVFLLSLIGAFNNAFTGSETALLFIGFGIGFLILGTIIALHIAAGRGLLKEKVWAQRLSTVLAIVQLVNFPVGTLIGSFILYTLYGEAQLIQREVPVGDDV